MTVTHDSEFVYNVTATLVNYQCKKRKNTVLLSSMHVDGVVDKNDRKKKPEIIFFYNSTKGPVDTMDKLAHTYTTKRATKQKPEIILFYNSTKGAVDTMDKLAHTYTTKRATKRWPLVMFSNILGLATVAARCVWKIKSERAHPEHQQAIDATQHETPSPPKNILGGLSTTIANRLKKRIRKA